MKKKLQLFSIILATCLLAVSLIGCSNGETKNQTPDGTDSSGNEAKYPDVYYQGFRLVEFSGQTSDETYKEIQNYIAEQSGVLPVPVHLPRGSETEKLNLLISSADERLDIIFSGSWQDYAEKGMLLPLNDLIDKYGPNIKKAWSENEYMWDMVSDDEGTIWALPRSLPTTSYPTWIRKDWLDKYGLEMPTTLEEFENILRTFKENDPAGNGQTIPLLTDLGGVYNAFSAGFTEHGYGNWQDTDGRIKPAVLQPGFKEAIETMARWYKEGYVYKESFTINREQQEQLVSANRVGSTMMWYSLIAAQEDYLKANVPEAEYDFARGLKGPKGLVETRTKPGSSGMMILKKAKNPEAAIKLLDWIIASRENFVTPLYGIKDVDWEYVDEEKGLFKRISERYNGDFYIYPNNVSLRQYGVVGEDGKANKMTQFLMDYQYRYDDVKDPLDFDVVYPANVMDELAPNILKKYKMYYLLLLPGLLFLIIFHYIPLFGVVIAFKDYHPFMGVEGIFTSEWVGFKHFKKFFNSYYFGDVLGNTLAISLLKFVFGFPAPIILALLLNEVRNEKYKKTVQTISYLPHFLSWVVVSGLLVTVLSVDGGLLNELRKALDLEPIMYLGNPKYFRTILVVSDIWKGVGWGSIIYLAAITGVNPQLHEAAIIDGANKWVRIRHITLPSISNIIVIMMIMRVGGLLNAGFEQIFLLYSPAVYDVADIIDTFVYREGLISNNYSYSTAVGLFKSLISMALLLTTNFIAKKLDQEGIW